MGMIKAKVKAEKDAWKANGDGSPKDWLKKPWDTHAYVDMYTEAFRHMPYYMGHVAAVVVPVWLAITIAGWLL